jgi:hypothetical protein
MSRVWVRECRTSVILDLRALAYRAGNRTVGGSVFLERIVLGTSQKQTSDRHP